MSDFWAMGGYAPYVWSSYGLALVVLVGNMLWPYWRLRALKRRLQEKHDND